MLDTGITAILALSYALDIVAQSMRIQRSMSCNESSQHSHQLRNNICDEPECTPLIWTEESTFTSIRSGQAKHVLRQISQDEIC
jgi:hypothetical protein